MNQIKGMIMDSLGLGFRQNQPIKNQVGDENVNSQRTNLKDAVKQPTKQSIIPTKTTQQASTQQRAVFKDLSNTKQAVAPVNSKSAKPIAKPTTTQPALSKPVATTKASSAAILGTSRPALTTKSIAPAAPVKQTAAPSLSLAARPVVTAKPATQAFAGLRQPVQAPLRSQQIIDESDEELEEFCDDDLECSTVSFDDDSAYSIDQSEAMEVDDELGMFKVYQTHDQFTVHPNLPPNVEDIDSIDFEDPRFLADYIMDIHTVLKQLEEATPIDANYCAKQKNIHPNMRGMVVDWLSEVTMKCVLRSDTFFLGVQLFDRFLSTLVVPRSKLQLIGAASLLLAAKFEEIYSVQSEDLVALADGDFTKDDLFKAEATMLRALQWNLTVPTSLLFLRRYTKAAKVDIQIHTLCKFIVELALAEYRILQFKASIQAASAAYLARRMVGITPAWDETMEYYAGYSEEELTPCSRLLNEIIMVETRRPRDQMKAVVLKYLDPSLYRVAAVPAISNF